MRLRNRRAFLSLAAALCVMAATTATALGAAPLITGQSAVSGRAGQTVTLTGSGFTGATKVLFRTMTTSAAFVVGSDTSITATVPSGAASGRISVVTPAGTAISPHSYQVKAAALKLSGFAPTTAAVGATVVIHGSALTRATGVKVGSVAATFTVKSDTEIDAVVPTGAVSGRVAVTTPAGTVTSAGRLIVPTLRIARFAPTTAAAGSSVVLTGAGFTGATAVQFKGISATFHVDSDKQITATVPAGASPARSRSSRRRSAA